MTDNNHTMLDFGEPDKGDIIIKVIGVGGGGGNAVTHMYNEGIDDVSFLLCNTDAQALKASPVPAHLQMGPGLGAGGNPVKGRKHTEASEEQIKELLNDGTKMVFITAGMGGGTGTGGAPVIARISKSMGILTVGIVTIPFLFEGENKIDQALDGVEEMAKHVDALLVINNERLRDLYSDLDIMDAFAKADDTLCVAAKSIAEIITTEGFLNLDFEDVTTVLKDGGIAIMSTGYGEGEGRVKAAIEDALNSPLLNNNNVFNSKRILLSISYNKEGSGNTGLRMEEMNDVHEFMGQFKNRFEGKWGLTVNPELGNKVKVTLLASGFGLNDVDGMNEHMTAKAHQEALEANTAKEEEEERKAERRDGYYGKKEDVKKRAHVFVFKSDELDDEDIILKVEDLPTYKRTNQQLNDIRRKIESLNEINKEPERREPVQGTINFSEDF